MILLALQLTFVLGLIQFSKSNVKLTNAQIAWYSVVFFYFSVVAFAMISNIVLQHQLDSFDLNHDGIFSGGEISSEQQAALNEVSADTARNFAPIVAIPYSLIYFLILYFVLKVFRKKPTGI